MNSLIFSDIHLADDSINEYRWGLFPFLKQVIAQNSIEVLACLGDITERKDNHKATFVNKVVEEFTELAKLVDRLIILKGNHDYIDQNIPFFSFLNKIPKLEFIIKPTYTAVGNQHWLLLPNTAFPEVEWELVLKEYKSKPCDLITCHQTFNGARSEYGEGITLSGISPDIFKDFDCPVISGDIHKNQKINDQITYVGAPFHTRSGDNYQGRVLVLKDKEQISVPFETLKKHSVLISKPSDLEKINFKPNDHAKIKLELDNLLDWEDYRKQIIAYCEQHEIKLTQGIQLEKVVNSTKGSKFSRLDKQPTNSELFQQYCKTLTISEDVYNVGMGILDKVHASTSET